MSGDDAKDGDGLSRKGRDRPGPRIPCALALLRATTRPSSASSRLLTCDGEPNEKELADCPLIVTKISISDLKAYVRRSKSIRAGNEKREAVERRGGCRLFSRRERERERGER